MSKRTAPSRTWLTRPNVRQLHLQQMRNQPPGQRSIELPTNLADFVDQEAARTGLTEQGVLQFALGLLAHCSLQTADTNLVISAGDGHDGYDFRSWAVPASVTQNVIAVAVAA